MAIPPIPKSKEIESFRSHLKQESTVYSKFSNSSPANSPAGSPSSESAFSMSAFFVQRRKLEEKIKSKDGNIEYKHYEDLFDKSIELIIQPFESVAAHKRDDFYSRSFFHEPARGFIQRNVNLLRKSLEALKASQAQCDLEFERVHSRYRRIFLGVEKIGMLPEEEQHRQKEILTSLIPRIEKAINQENSGLKHCEALVESHLHRSALFLNAAEDLRKRSTSIIMCPHIDPNWEDFGFRKMYEGNQGDLGKQAGDTPMEVLASFYTNYIQVLHEHKSYFKEAIGAHQELLTRIQDILKKI